MKLIEIKDFLKAQQAKVDKVMKLKRGDKIDVKLDWVRDGSAQGSHKGEYVVTGTVGNVVYKDEYGREVPKTNDDATLYVQVSYMVDGKRINNTFTREYLLKNLR
jgi:hypothetical protein